MERNIIQEIQPLTDRGLFKGLLILDGIIYPLTDSKFKIGRSIQNDMVLNNNQTAPFHAEIQFRNGQYHIQNTTAGYFLHVNGESVNSCILHSGDILQIAHNSIVFISKKVSFSVKARQFSLKLRKITEKIHSFFLF